MNVGIDKSDLFFVAKYFFATRENIFVVVVVVRIIKYTIGLFSCCYREIL